MRKQSFKTIRLFIKLLLLFQIYSYHCFKAEATDNNYQERFNEGEVGEKLGLHEISDQDASLNIIERPKRPARLLPLRIILGKEKNKTEKEDMKRFNGPAKSCEELLKIGYTRNGFYLVKGINATSNSHVEMVDCLFRNPNGVKEVKEKRLGFLPLKTSFRRNHYRRSIESFVETFDSETDKERSKRPGRLLPLQLLSKKNNNTEEKYIQKQFYGPPTNCVELGKIGYTLNGYYFVIKGQNSNSRQIEVILCRFQLQPNNETAMEERLGFIRLEQNVMFTGKLQSNGKEINDNALQTSITSIARKRRRRPARLIPLKLLKNGKNQTEKQTTKQLNSNPANCDDIGKLGYTLNGFYIVNGNENTGRFEVVFCQFSLPPKGSSKKKGKASITEKRFGVIRVLDCPREAKIGNYKVLCNGWSAKYGNMPSSLDMANLINGFDKGLGVYGDFSKSGYMLLQLETRDSNYSSDVWSYNEPSLGSGDRHLCNGFGKCVTSAKTNVLENNGTMNWEQMGWVRLKQWDYSDDESQRFYFLDSLTYPGFYIIKDEFGKCISVPDNMEKHGAEIWACHCNSSPGGQLWQWHYLDKDEQISPFDLNNRRAKLINGLGKCASVYTKDKINRMCQWDCDQKKNKAMLWSWNEETLGSKNRHICNGLHQCVASMANVDWSNHLIVWSYFDEGGQRYNFVDLLDYPGFYVIRNDHEKCLSVKGNTNKTGAEIWADDCKTTEAGQRWKWHH